MGQMHSRQIDAPDETRKFQQNGYANVVTLGDFTLLKGTRDTTHGRWATSPAS